MLSLKVEKRLGEEKPAGLRRAGVLPAVLYGKKEASTPIKLPESDFIRVFKKAGESMVITLELGAKKHEALIMDVDKDPVSERVRHADFYVIEAGQKVRIKIPLEFNGISPAVKDLGCTLIKVLHEIEVEAEPKHLPHMLTVDIASLVTLESRIMAKDIKLPDSVALITGPEEVVASVAAAREEEPDEPTTVDLSTIEVEKKGKEKTSEELAAEAAAGGAAGTPEKGKAEKVDKPEKK
jgi:large subunit ribosomal protein L25